MIDLGDAAGDDVARMAYNAFTRALSSRKTVSKTKIEQKSPEACEQAIPQAVVDAARASSFAPGDPANRVIEVALDAADPQAKMISAPLDRAGIPYAAKFTNDGAKAVFEVSREGGMFVESLAARYVAAGIMDAARFPGLRLPEGLNRYNTIEIRGFDEFRAVADALEKENVKFRCRWSQEAGAGVFAFDGESFERAHSILEARAVSPAAWQESPAVDARSTAADEPAGRASIIFQTREDDPEASIIKNALKREGVNDFTVATPDPQGQVVISVAKSDAPALVQVCESYIDRNLIECERFNGLEALRERSAAEREAAVSAAREGDLEKARSQAQRLSANRGTVTPELSRAVSR